MPEVPIEIDEIPHIPEEIEIDERNVRRLRGMLTNDGIPRDPDVFIALLNSMLGHEELPPEETTEAQYQAIKTDLLAMVSGDIGKPQTVLNHALFLLGMVEGGRV
jgi:hypothetical protein